MSEAILKHDTWLYSPEEPTGRLFREGDGHPGKGWKDTPDPRWTTPNAANATQHDADGDGKPGGSAPKK